MSKNQWVVLFLFAGTLILICGLIVVAVGLWQLPLLFEGPPSAKVADQPRQPPTPTPIPQIERTPIPPLATASPQPAPATPAKGLAPTVEAGPEPGHQASPLTLTTEERLLQATIPERDQRLLAIRLKNKGEDIPQVVDVTQPYEVGDTDTFWVTDNQESPPRQFQVTASLQHVTPHSYWWVQDGFNVNAQGLKRSAERFENDTYPTNRAFFGSEWSPGVDNDVRVHIFMGDVPGVAGYFSASNEYSNLAEPYSNQREMFFVNLKAISPGNDYFDSILAHEFQHMIHWYQDRNEDTWVNEGLSELATFLNDYGVSNFMGAFTSVPDTQLNTWTDTPGAALADYGASFLFMAYFLERYGHEMTQAVVANANNGIHGFDTVLAENGYSERFNDIFVDFLVANYLDNPDAGQGQWGYDQLSLNPVTPVERYSVYPVDNQTTVYQYGGDYIELTGRDDLTISFTGSTQVKVVDNRAHSGSYQWYSHRGDDSNSRLTRAFDLSQVDSATLNYWTWYDIETDWDYGYVEISTDGGQTWTILETPHSATTNPSGNAYGPGYTGTSGQDGPQPTWIEETIDISAYTGQEVFIRFEYVTDDAVNRPGWTIDDISIPEIEFYDDVESGSGAWQAEGFVPIDNVLSQRFSVQLLEIGEEITIRPVPLDQTNQGSLTVTGLGQRIDRAILIVSGLTPITTQPASYAYEIRPAE